MSKITKISIALTPEMADMLKAAVESGEYATSSEVIRDALRDWKERRSVREAFRDRQVEDLRRQWHEGLESGGAAPWDSEEIRREGKKLLEKERQKK